jgi:hypothetical protein
LVPAADQGNSKRHGTMRVIRRLQCPQQQTFERTAQSVEKCHKATSGELLPVSLTAS